MAEAISFEVIRKIQREERDSPKLSKLPKDFYQQAESYLKQKRKRKKQDLSSAVEIRNIQKLLEDIYNRRERKILNHALIATRTDIPPENLMSDEAILFDNIIEKLKARRKKVLNTFSENVKENKEDLVEVVFKEDIERFVGSDMKNYGPFKKGDRAKLPKNNVDVLKNRGAVK